MLEQGIYHLLVTDATIQAVCQNVYLGVMPKGYTLPALRVSRVWSQPETTLDGTIPFNTARVQFDAYAPLGQYVKAKQVNFAVRALLEDYRGDLKDDANNVLATIVGSEVLMDCMDHPLEEATGGYAHVNLLEIRFQFINES